MKINELTKIEMQELLKGIIKINDYLVVRTINQYLIDRYNRVFDKLLDRQSKLDFFGNNAEYWKLNDKINELTDQKTVEKYFTLEE